MDKNHSKRGGSLAESLNSLLLVLTSILSNCLTLFKFIRVRSSRILSCQESFFLSSRLPPPDRISLRSTSCNLSLNFLIESPGYFPTNGFCSCLAKSSIATSDDRVMVSLDESIYNCGNDSSPCKFDIEGIYYSIAKPMTVFPEEDIGDSLGTPRFGPRCLGIYRFGASSVIITLSALLLYLNDSYCSCCFSFPLTICPTTEFI